MDGGVDNCTNMSDKTYKQIVGEKVPSYNYTRYSPLENE